MPGFLVALVAATHVTITLAQSRRRTHRWRCSWPRSRARSSSGGGRCSAARSWRAGMGRATPLVGAAHAWPVNPQEQELLFAGGGPPPAARSAVLPHCVVCCRWWCVRRQARQAPRAGGGGRRGPRRQPAAGAPAGRRAPPATGWRRRAGGRPAGGTAAVRGGCCSGLCSHNVHMIREVSQSLT